VDGYTRSVRTHVALLRGINVGGNNMVKMAELRALFEALGFRDVETILQSGNVVFSSDQATSASLERLLRTETVEKLGVDVEYFVRTAPEWLKVIEGNPFEEEAGNDPARLHLFSFHDEPDASAVERLQAASPGPEQIRTFENHLYITFPDGIGNSKLLKTQGAKFLTLGTARNWNTVLKLLTRLL
jgi:uncharacterized protein (DUF1697 family)